MVGQKYFKEGERWGWGANIY